MTACSTQHYCNDVALLHAHNTHIASLFDLYTLALADFLRQIAHEVQAKTRKKAADKQEPNVTESLAATLSTMLTQYAAHSSKRLKR